MDRALQTQERFEGAHSDGPLDPSPGGLPEEPRTRAQPPAAWCAQALIQPARAAGEHGVLFIASSDRRAEEIARALRQMAPYIEVLLLPAWDCLPYDRASPSREVMGRRMAVLAAIGEPANGHRVVVAPVESVIQRLPPSQVVSEAFTQLRRGEVLDRREFETFVLRTGYVTDDRIDEPGEVAVLGSVIDIFPAAADSPLRVTLEENDCIAELKRYDPLSQRSEEAVAEVLIGPASELVLSADMARDSGAEHQAPSFYPMMDTLLGRLPTAVVWADAKAHDRAVDFLEQVAEAYEARRAMPGEIGQILQPNQLYLTVEEFHSATKSRSLVGGQATDPARIPNFALERSPGKAFSDYVRGRLDEGRRVALTGLPHELRPIARAAKRGLDLTPTPASNWDEVAAAEPGELIALQADVDAGFDDRSQNLTLVAAADVLGGRIAQRRGGSTSGSVLSDPDLRVGDVVIHEDYGLGAFTALEKVEVGDEVRDALRLEYHNAASLLVPIEEFGKIWRYGAEREAVSLDRLHTDAWSKRRAELSADIDRTAEHLVGLARERAAVPGIRIEPPKAAYARLAARFPYPETPDQAAAIDAVLADMASGGVMNRLVCGDVGFGKTEVALRAAAAVALCGKQVALIAPTTVLARQHFDTLHRRFAGTEIRIGRLSRLTSSKEARSVKDGLADGTIQVVVATHALAADDVGFQDLGLIIIDEEQRFGAAIKAKLRALGPRAHRLTMTATPIPRTLQLAMAGIEEVSVIETPPARRRPIRTFLAPYDPATVRTALMRERRRSGQSFVVAPRIEDIAPTAEVLAQLAPELKLHVVHGQLPADKVDEVMVRFAAGEGDVLLATNIIESGLDVPRANTMLVMRADLFGLAQLHQLRGRVGRGRTQGVTYLFHDAEVDLPDATRARLSTLEAFDRLGSGLTISARDLELRGAGDLIGEDQAGHLKLIGTALYQRLLSRAVRVAKGELSGPEWTPQMNIGVTGSIPEDYVPDPTIRINLYARLARLSGEGEVDDFAEEFEDRFGPVPDEVRNLFALARTQIRAAALEIVKLDAGPKAVALTFAPQVGLERFAGKGGFELSRDRLVWRGPVPEGLDRAEIILGLLDALAE